jgi:hypothetical protein
MVIGGIWVAKNKVKQICSDIRKIKEQHGFSRMFEFKWNQKVSPSSKSFFEAVIKYFFENDSLNFRCIVADKTHTDIAINTDFYYKMYYQMLINIIKRDSAYNVYVDIKNKGQDAVKLYNLKLCLSRRVYDFNNEKIKKIQSINSKDTELLQLADLFSGLVSYVNRDLQNKTKLELIELVRQYSGISLRISTLPSEKKFNIFFWSAREGC